MVLGMMKASNPPTTLTPSSKAASAASARGRKRPSQSATGMRRLVTSSAVNSDTKTSGTVCTTRPATYTKPATSRQRPLKRATPASVGCEPLTACLPSARAALPDASGVMSLMLGTHRVRGTLPGTAGLPAG